MLCVGLDPDPRRLPAAVGHGADAVFAFCRDIVDATADLVCAFKPQFAHFAAQRAEPELERLCAHIRDTHPGVTLVLDAKRGDIGSTAEHYATEAFDRYGAHAVTVNPYLGTDAIEPFLTHPSGAAIILCRTSNPGGADLQSLVVGATYPDELATVRAIVGELPILVPGVGAQGGDIAATVAAGRDTTGFGMIVNNSRGVNYASSCADFADAARRAAITTRDELALAASAAR
jgi:orotidine-5'-phosphate decarboxylase